VLIFFFQNLCNTAGTIQDGLLAVSCACNSLSFNGTWSPDVTTIIPSISNPLSCFESNCADVLYAQSLICYGTPTTLFTYEANLTFTLTEKTCVNVSVNLVSGHVYSSAPQSPIALSFLQTNFDMVGKNLYAVVVNDNGVVVGQIHGAMIQIIVQNLSSNDSFTLHVSPCLLLDPTVGDVNQSEFDIFVV